MDTKVFDWRPLPRREVAPLRLWRDGRSLPGHATTGRAERMHGRRQKGNTCRLKRVRDSLQVASTTRFQRQVRLHATVAGLRSKYSCYTEVLPALSGAERSRQYWRPLSRLRNRFLESLCQLCDFLLKVWMKSIVGMLTLEFA